MNIPLKTNYKIYEGLNKYYMRTIDVASILGILQPFAFTFQIRSEFKNDKVILKGDDTKSFRSKDDSSRATFIQIEDLYLFLTECKIKHRINQDRKEYLLTYLENLI